MTAPKALDTPYDQPRIFGSAYRAATIGILLVITLIAFEGMSVSVVMPIISQQLDALDLYGLSFSAFLIASLFANVVSGLWSDRRGYTMPFLLGVVLFVVGMGLAGAAATKVLFLAARGVQGLGAGCTIVAVYVMIARVYPAAVRPKIFAALSAAWVVPAMVGPAVAGFVAYAWGWRWVFFGIIPLVVPALVMLVPALKKRADGPAESGSSDEGDGSSEGARSRPFAMTVAATAAAGGAGVLLYGVDKLHISPVPSAVAVLAGLACLGYGLAKLLPPGALRFRRGLPTTIMMRGMFSAAFFGVNSFIPLALQQVKEFGPAAAGIALTTGALGWSTGSYLQSRRSVEPHRRIRLGAACVMAGVLIGLLSVVPGITGWVAVPAWIVAGFGMGLGMTTVSVTALKQSPVNEQGANSAALSVTDMLGSALAVGVGGALVNVIGHSPGMIARGFVVICCLMSAIALAATLLASRTRAD
ncbi:MFS transporter [Nonomuraea sp. NEAU-A123]|uniref:MFS transporter n=1 Tax=Nonomuraea sp. NEAU-A123 TaxID=2839649 RepID=UPI001BE3E8C4|nr:MFS transporter [Nonomuraea sp. NEAU-A123]MBT2232828.1 MFS transporter [Nonomuraea sp. NEAU-A123]